MIPEALTFKDVLLTPRRSPIASRGQVDTTGRFSRKIQLKVPLVSANMDTVTEAEMAIAMARLGGLGIVHRFLSIAEEVAEVAKVKRAESVVIEDPYTLGPDATVGEAQRMMEDREVGGLLIVDRGGKLIGVVTERDVRFEERESRRVSEVMTRKLIVGTPGMGEAAARALLAKHKLEKLPLVDKRGGLAGLITAKDILKRRRFPDASKDSKGRLLVGAAIGVVGDYLERAQALHDAGADVLVLDVAHGHADHVIKAVRALKRQKRSFELVAGNVATFEGARDLAAAGADAIKVGVGPGATCSTRVVTGSGVPQLSAVMDAARITKLRGVPICADGGIRDSGDITKALAGGASSIMIGSLLAGTDESPGWTIVRGG
ncbi:MAG: IMP dehydrogenase, partial [Elusimicrobia bacterium CG1_02_63_36]